MAIRQILTNLVGNAVNFTAAGEVALAVGTKQLGTDGTTLAFVVPDTGIGIEPHVVDRLFDAFTQASSERVTRFGGGGLGLTITRRPLGLNGSRVQVESVPGRDRRVLLT